MPTLSSFSSRESRSRCALPQLSSAAVWLTGNGLGDGVAAVRMRYLGNLYAYARSALIDQIAQTISFPVDVCSYLRNVKIPKTTRFRRFNFKKIGRFGRQMKCDDNSEFSDATTWTVILFLCHNPELFFCERYSRSFSLRVRLSGIWPRGHGNMISVL